MYQVAVLAGGLGTRLREVTGEVLPKALVPVGGRPFLEWKLEELARQGATRVVLLVGHGAGEIRAHIGDGSRFGIDIAYVEDGPELRGTGGALLHALPMLTDLFWVTYGDTLLDFDVAAAEHTFERSDADMLMTVLQNSDDWEASNVVIDGEYVAAYSKSPAPPGAKHIDYGMLAFRKRAWRACSSDSFDISVLIETLVAARQVRAFEVTARFHEIGTVAALRETERHLSRPS